MQAKRLYQELYLKDYLFCPKWPLAEVNKTFNTHIENADGAVFNVGEFTVIWVSELSIKTLGRLHHECIHAANITLSERGVEVDQDNDEALCYLSQWIFEKCLRYMRK